LGEKAMKSAYLLIEWVDLESPRIDEGIVFDTKSLANKYVKKHNIKLEERDDVGAGWTLSKIRRILVNSLSFFG